MNPSSRSTFATATLSLVAGISTSGRSISLALRMRVSMSAIGSVIMAVFPSVGGGGTPHGFPLRPPPVSRLPGRLADAGDHPVAREFAEADAAAAELAVNGPRPTADLAAADDLHEGPAGEHLFGVPLRGRLLQLGLVLIHRRQLTTVLRFFRVG